MAARRPRPRRSSRACQGALERWTEAAAWMRAAGHPLRLHLLACLAEGPRCVGDLNELVPVSQPMLSQHMAALRRAGLVDCHARGNRRCYFLTHPQLVEGILEAVGARRPRRAPSRDEVFAAMERPARPEGRRITRRGKKGMSRGT